MTDIPEEIMARARDLSRSGCGCDEVEAQTCEHVRECLCTRQEQEIARAIMEAEMRGRAQGLEEAARAAEGLASSYRQDALSIRDRTGECRATTIDFAKAEACETIATAIRALAEKGE